jgi:heme a synthase
MRHSDAGLAIVDFPLSYGALVPSTDELTLDEINLGRAEIGLPPVASSQIWIHFAHRVGAILVMLAVALLVQHVLSTFQDRRLREPALLVGMLVVVQALLGALTVWTGKGVEIATTHVVTGALLLALSTVLAARAFRMFPIPARSVSYATVASASRP